MMTIKEFAKLGGKARWINKTKEERSQYMKDIRNKREQKKFSTVTPIDKQACKD